LMGDVLPSISVFFRQHDYNRPSFKRNFEPQAPSTFCSLCFRRVHCRVLVIFRPEPKQISTLLFLFFLVPLRSSSSRIFYLLPLLLIQWRMIISGAGTCQILEFRFSRGRFFLFFGSPPSCDCTPAVLTFLSEARFFDFPPHVNGCCP